MDAPSHSSSRSCGWFGRPRRAVVDVDGSTRRTGNAQIAARTAYAPGSRRSLAPIVASRPCTTSSPRRHRELWVILPTARFRASRADPTARSAGDFRGQWVLVVPGGDCVRRPGSARGRHELQARNGNASPGSFYGGGAETRKHWWRNTTRRRANHADVPRNFLAAWVALPRGSAGQPRAALSNDPTSRKWPATGIAFSERHESGEPRSPQRLKTPLRRW